MKFKSIDEIYFKIDLKSTHKNSKNKYTSREGYIIKLYLDTYCGLGESSPLMHFSNESFSDVVYALEELKHALIPNVSYDKPELLKLFNLFTKNVPSLNFALDMALFDIYSKKNNLSISKYLNPKSADHIKFNSFYFDDLVNPGNTIKIKFGIDSIDNDLVKFRKICNTYPPSTLYRIDANGAYSVSEILYLCKELEGYNIQYIEEPLLNLSHSNLLKLKESIDIPIALDESIHKPIFSELIELGLIDYVVLKASLFGSIDKIQKLIKHLYVLNIKIIISSGLHTIIGNMANIHIAAMLNTNDEHGLNNHSFFNYDINKTLYKPYDKIIDLKSIIGLGIADYD